MNDRENEANPVIIINEHKTDLVDQKLKSRLEFMRKVRFST